MAAPIEILTETEAERGWRFTAQAVQPDGALLPLTMELSWADYDFWCPDGTAPPAVVAECALRLAQALACASRLRQDECRAGATPNLQKAFVPMVFDDTRNLGHSGGSDRCRGTAAWPELPSARSGPRGQGMME